MSGLLLGYALVRGLLGGLFMRGLILDGTGRSVALTWGNGRGDDSPALQRAMRDTSDGSIHMGPGTFVLGSTIDLHDAHLVGAGLRVAAPDCSIRDSRITRPRSGYCIEFTPEART